MGLIIAEGLIAQKSMPEPSRLAYCFQLPDSGAAVFGIDIADSGPARK